MRERLAGGTTWWVFVWYIKCLYFKTCQSTISWRAGGFLVPLITDAALNNSKDTLLPKCSSFHCAPLLLVGVPRINFCPVLVTSLCSGSSHRRDFPFHYNADWERQREMQLPP